MKNGIKNAYLFVNKRSLLIFLTSAILLAFAALPIFYLHSQSKKRIQDREKILERSNDFNSPVEITLAKSKLGVIETRQKFFSG